MTIGKKGKYLSVLIIFTLGLLFSSVISFKVYQFEREKLELLFGDLSFYRYKLIEDLLQANQGTAESLVSFYAASVSVESDEFNVYTQGFFERQPYIFEFRWLPKVSGSARQEFETAARASGLPDFTIKKIGEDAKFAPALKRDVYFPVYHIHTSAQAKYSYTHVLGLDAASIPERWQAMQYAWNTGEAALVTESKQYGELNIDTASRIFTPIFKNNLPHNTLEERRENLLGFVVLLFRLDELVDKALEGVPAVGVDIAIYDSISVSGRLIYFYSDKIGKPSEPLGTCFKDAERAPFSWSEILPVVDKRWKIVCTPSSSFFATHWIIFPWVIFIIGLILTMALALYLRSIVNRESNVKLLIQKRTDELRRLEERYRNLYEFSADAIMTIESPEWNFTSGNVVAIKLFGAIDEKNFISKRPWELSPERQPNGELSSVKAKEMIDIAMEKGSHSFEWQHQKVGGEVFTASVLLSRIDSAEKAYLQATVRDITLIKEVESKILEVNKEWFATFNSISDFVFILNKESVVTKVNKSMLSALQLKEEDVIGRKCFEIVHKKNCPWPGCPHQQTIKDGRAHTEEVLDPGLGLPLLVSTSPILDAKGEIAGSVHIAKDISSIKNKEEELKKTKEGLEVEAWGLNKANEGIKVLYKELEQKNIELRKFDQLKSDFVSIVSHELRTPLAIMKEGVSLVLDRVTGEINPKASSTLEMVYNNINRLAKLISDLLDVSKIEAGRLQLKKVLTDINILVKDTIDKWVPEANKNKLELSVIPSGEQLNVYVDPDKIIQILSNLVSNAIKFTPENGKITVQVSSNKDEVEVSVSDNGVGISAVDLPKVFGKFQQFERSAGGGAKGTGLGLAICKELVELHEGLIKVESSKGAGTKFSFNLPIKDSDSVFKEHINEAIKTVASRNSKLSVISVRIYDFNRLKKELGLNITHNLLKEIERTITGTLHAKSDIVFRDIGEIIIILFDINKESAQAVRLHIEEVIKSFLTGSREEFIRNTTFNIGIAYYPEDAKDDNELLDKVRGVVHV